MRSASEKRNFELVDKVFGPIDDKASSIGVQALSLDEKVVYFIWAALGLIENGSFQYFFENQMDPDATAKAYDQLGLPAVAECFRLAQSLLPDEYCRLDWNRQLQILQEKEASLDVLAKRVLAETIETENRLAKFILSHPNLRALV